METFKMQTIENPGSVNHYLAKHEGQTIEDYLRTLSAFSRFVTEAGLSDTELLNGAYASEATTEDSAA